VPTAAAIYLDHHATTPLDPRVVAAMLPCFTDCYGNPASKHAWGHAALEQVEQARASIAHLLGASEREVVFTSGATESNNLALLGMAEHRRRRGQHIVSVTTEHRAVLDPLRQLAARGFEITLLGVAPKHAAQAGMIDLGEFESSLRDDTCLVSVMAANNEMGLVQPLAEIAAICQAREIPLHCDASQAVGKIPIDFHSLGIDLLSCTAHKIYGPKGIGALLVRRRSPPLRLAARQFGGGHEQGLRSGTLNVPGIVGFAAALRLCSEVLAEESQRLAQLRQQLWNGLQERIEGLTLNGPTFTSSDTTHRLPGNLNCCLGDVQAEAVLLSVPELALSTGAACSSAQPEPSHVLLAMGRTADEARASLRFGIGRFNTADEITRAVELLARAVGRLRKMSS
jgi:cysteine desulfurase